MILIEINAAVDDAGTVQTFYLSDTRFTTTPTDTPANMSFEPLLKDPGTIEVLAFSDGKTTGNTELSVGEIVLVNADGRYDAWVDYSFHGRPVLIRSGNAGAYPDDFDLVFTGTVQDIQFDQKRVLIRLKDKQHILDRPVLTTRYDGSNSGATGVEGTAADIKGQVKPRIYGGKVFKIKPPPVNTSKLTYQVSDEAVYDITAVYDRGVSLTKGADYASLALLNAAAPAAGNFITCNALGLFRLGSAPAGLILADATGSNTAALKTAAGVIKALALDAGVTLAEIDTADVSDMDTAQPAPVGIFINDDRTYRDAMDEIARSVGAYYGFDPAGVLIMGIWQEPQLPSVLTLAEYYVGASYERRPARDNEGLVWSVKCNYARNYEVQTSDFAGSVGASDRANFGLEYRAEVYENAALKAQYLLATTLEIDSLLTEAADAADEAERVQLLYGVRRDSFEVPVPLYLVGRAGLTLGKSCVTLQISRFGLDGGRLMRVQGIRLEFGKGRALLTVWG